MRAQSPGSRLRRYGTQPDMQDRFMPPRRSSSRRIRTSIRKDDQTDVKVIVRLRPSFYPEEIPAFFVAGNASSSDKLLWQPDPQRASCEEVTFHKVIGPSVSNSELHEELDLARTVQNAVDGYAETVFAYGQTGSGKTHTMIGIPDSPGEGILQRCARDLFRAIPPNDASRSIQLTCVEVKNNSMVVDLLGKVSGFDCLSQSPALGVDKASHERISVMGKPCFYRKATVSTYEETIALLRGAFASREVGYSSLNSESSRSHMVVRFYITTYGDQLTVGSMTLVDLAGSESENESGGETTTAINVSLTHLNRFLVKMQFGEVDESDRRQSTLNMMLYDSLKEDCGVHMIFCIHPDRQLVPQSRSTISMASRCRCINSKKRIRQLLPEDMPMQDDDVATLLAQQKAFSLSVEKNDELRVTAEKLEQMEMKFESLQGQTKDFESMRKQLQERLEGRKNEDRDIITELERKNSLLEAMIAQMQAGGHPQYTAEGDPKLQDLHNQYRNLEHMVSEERHVFAGHLGDLRGKLAASEKANEKLRERVSCLESLSHHRNPQVYPVPCVDGPKGEQNTTSGPISGQNTTSSHWDANRDNYGLPGNWDPHRGNNAMQVGQHGGTLGTSGDPQRGSDGTPDDVRRGSYGGTPDDPRRCSNTSLSWDARRGSYTSTSEDAGIGTNTGMPAFGLPVQRASVGDLTFPGWNVEEQCHGGEQDPAERMPSLWTIGSPTRKPLSRDSVSLTSEQFSFGGENRASVESRGLHANVQDSGNFFEGSTASSHGSSSSKTVSQITAQMSENSSIEQVQVQGLRLLLNLVLKPLKRPTWSYEAKADVIQVAVRAMEAFPNLLRAQRDGALLLAEICGRDKELKSLVVAQGGLRQAIATLTLLDTAPRLGDVCVACFRLLAVLSQRDLENQVHCRNSIAPILHALAHSREVSDVVVHGCWSMMNVCNKCVENQVAFRRLGGFPLLISLLDAHVEKLTLGNMRAEEKQMLNACAYIGGCLASVTEGCKKNQAALQEGGGLRALVNVLNLPPELLRQSPTIASNACIAIAHASHRNVTVQKIARELQVFPRLLYVLHIHPQESAAQGNACRAVATLTESNKENQDAVLACTIPGVATNGRGCDVVSLLFRALTLQPEDCTLATTVCWALANLSMGNLRGMVAITQDVATIVNLLHKFHCDERLCEYSCRLVAEITRGDSDVAQANRKQLAELGIVNLIRSIIQKHEKPANQQSRRSGAVVRAKDALRNF